MKSILLIGKTGQLGAEILQSAPFFDFQVFAYGRDELDITDTAAVREVVQRHRPSIIINTAAFHVVPQCEVEPSEAFRVNCIAVSNLAKIAKENGARFMTFSTDYVFDGEKGAPYMEDDTPRPIQFYGISKLAGEYAAQNIFPEGVYIIRTCGLYGGREGSKSRGGNLVLKMLKDAEKSNSVEVSSAEIANPTSTKDLSEGVLKLLQNDAPPGIYHLVSEGQCSWYEFVREIYRLSGKKREVIPVDRGGFGDGIRRPKFSVLANSKARALGIILPYWQEGLAAYIKFLSEN